MRPSDISQVDEGDQWPCLAINGRDERSAEQLIAGLRRLRWQVEEALEPHAPALECIDVRLRECSGTAAVTHNSAAICDQADAGIPQSCAGTVEEHGDAARRDLSHLVDPVVVPVVDHVLHAE